jgi:N-acetylglucosaminyl-diphospho-decaprenol L-rhamnosyltransferase
MAAASAQTHATTVSTAFRSQPHKRPALRPVSAPEPCVSVVIVNYCQWRNTARLTRQLRRSHAVRAGDAQIVVVDNHSPRHRVLDRLRRTECVLLHHFTRNVGFARAVNKGCRIGKGDWVLLLNPDTSVPAGFLDDLETLTERLSLEPRIGIVGLDVRNADGSSQPSCGPLPTLLGTLAGLFLPRSRRKCRTLNAYVRTEVPWATGCALLIRRECLEDLGGLDEDFFLYYEDVDLCRRAVARGWKVCYEPTLHVTHHSPLHARSVPAALRLMTRHALLTYGLKNWRCWQTILLGGIVGMEATVRQSLAWWRGRSEDCYFHAEIRRLAADLLAGRHDRVRERIQIASERLENIAAAQDGQTC